MRIAVAGKGGAGKTTLAATMARLAAQRGRSACPRNRSRRSAEYRARRSWRSGSTAMAMRRFT
jgi:ABC-type glutathione transport system ATPase component